MAGAYSCFEHGVVGLEAAGALLPPVAIAGQGGDVPSHALPPLRDKKSAHHLALAFQLPAYMFGAECRLTNTMHMDVGALQRGAAT